MSGDANVIYIKIFNVMSNVIEFLIESNLPNTG